MAVGVATQELLDALAPWIAFDASGTLVIYITALGGMLDTVAGIVSDQGDPTDPSYVPGWSTLLDPNACPDMFLPFLAQFNGTQVPPGTSDAQARAIIKAESGFQRGTGPSIMGAAKITLTGTQSVFLLERRAANGSADAYHFVLVVRPEEVTTTAALTAAVNAVKPAGLQWTLVISDAWTWNQATGTWVIDTMTWDQTASIQP